MSTEVILVNVNTTALSDSDAPAPGRTRRNRGSEVVRAALINAAITEFAAHGFEGASTRRIAEAADAHQSQIKYHFDTKDDLWRRCLELLLDELDASIVRNAQESTGGRAVFEASLRGLVHFAARRPELSRIMMHEATSSSERLTWLVDTHIRPRHESLNDAWRDLVDDEVVATIDVYVLYDMVIGSSSLIYANVPEAQLLGIDPSTDDLINRHADALVALFLRR